MKNIFKSLILLVVLSLSLLANTSDDDYGNQNELKELVYNLDAQEKPVLIEEKVEGNTITLDIIYTDDLESDNKEIEELEVSEEEN